MSHAPGDSCTAQYPCMVNLQLVITVHPRRGSLQFQMLATTMNENQTSEPQPKTLFPSAYERFLRWDAESSYRFARLLALPRTPAFGLAAENEQSSEIQLQDGREAMMLLFLERFKAINSLALSGFLAPACIQRESTALILAVCVLPAFRRNRCGKLLVRQALSLSKRTCEVH